MTTSGFVVMALERSWRNGQLLDYSITSRKKLESGELRQAAR